VRVHPGVAVAGEVLGRGHGAASPGAPDECCSQAPHLLRVLAEGAGVDNGVLGVRVHIHHRREDHMDAHRPGLPGRGLAEALHQPGVPHRTEPHGGRKAGPAPLGEEGGEGVGMGNPHPGPSLLEVRGHQEGDSGPGLQGVQTGGVGQGGADGDDHAADGLLLHPPHELEELRIIVGGVGAADPGEDELAHRLPETEGSQGLLDPAVSAGVGLREEERRLPRGRGRGRGRDGLRRSARRQRRTGCKDKRRAETRRSAGAPVPPEAAPVPSAPVPKPPAPTPIRPGPNPLPHRPSQLPHRPGHHRHTSAPGNAGDDAP